MSENQRRGVSRRMMLKISGAAAAATAMLGRKSEDAIAHDLTPSDPIYRYSKYEAIVNRRDAQIRQVYQWPNIQNRIIHGNTRNGINGFQFSYGIPADSIQVVVQAYSSANMALYDDDMWEKYKLGELVDVVDPETEKPATRNIWYQSSVPAEEVETPPEDRDHAYFADTSIDGLQRRGVLYLI